MKNPIYLISVILLTAALSGCGAKQVDFGDWTRRLPEDRDYFYAVGGPAVGPAEKARPTAERGALAKMAEFIKVTIEVEIQSRDEEWNDKVNEQFIEKIRSQSKETLKYVSIVEVKKTPDGLYALARMPRRPLDELIEEIKFVKVPPSFGEIARSAMIPGWGQFHKGQTTKGIAILGSEAALIGGSVIFRSLRDDAHDKLLYARTTGARKTYQNREQNYERLMLGTLIGAGAIYLYNLVDVSTVPKRISSNQVALSFDADGEAVVLRYRWR